MTDHSPAFAAALAAVSALLGAPSHVERLKVSPWFVASWGRCPDYVMLDDAEGALTLIAARGKDSERWSIGGDLAAVVPAVRAACAWLGWAPRPDGCGEMFGDYRSDAA